MSMIWELFIEYMLWPLAILIVELVLRSIPSFKENSIVGLILDFLDKIKPSAAPGNRVHVRDKKIVDKNKVKENA